MVPLRRQGAASQNPQLLASVSSIDHGVFMDGCTPLELTLNERYRLVRQRTLALVEPLSPEDCQIQSMPDASPVKWHLAHTTWFWETFVLKPFVQNYQVFDSSYEFLFNSYYTSVGPRHDRPQRGMITRPALDEVRAYRVHIDEAMDRFFECSGDCLLYTSDAADE